MRFVRGGRRALILFVVGAALATAWLPYASGDTADAGASLIMFHQNTNGGPAVRFSATSIRIPVRYPDGRSAGVTEIKEMTNGNSLVSAGGWWDLVRPGTCSRTPPPNRVVHTWGGGDGELPIPFATLLHRSFAVQALTEDGRTYTCGYHRGGPPLAAHAQGIAADSRAFYRGGAIAFTGAVTGTIKPVGNGQRIRIFATTEDTTGDGLLAHIRPGTCRKVAGGREWPMAIRPDINQSPAHGSATLAMPFNQLLRSPYAFETHVERIGVRISHCYDLQPSPRAAASRTAASVRIATVMYRGKVRIGTVDPGEFANPRILSINCPAYSGAGVETNSRGTGLTAFSAMDFSFGYGRKLRLGRWAMYTAPVTGSSYGSLKGYAQRWTSRRWNVLNARFRPVGHTIGPDGPQAAAALLLVC